jgi:hypothetical protein
VQARLTLHHLAEHVVSPARSAVNGKIGLRYTHRGFGTPFFGEDEQLRVQGGELVRVKHGTEAGREPLDVDPDASAFLGDWYGFAASVLEELRAQVSPEHAGAPSRVQLWPEHFDMAIELGSEEDGARAAYGLSPGDEDHDEPYAYVAPWNPPESGEIWQAKAFTGAEMSYAEILAAADQRATVIDFMEIRLNALVQFRGSET